MNFLRTLFGRRHTANKDHVNEIFQLIASRNPDGVTTVGRFLERSLGRFQREKYEDYSLLKGRVGAWAIFQATEGTFKFIASSLRKMDGQRLGNCTIVATPHSGISSQCENTFLKEGFVKDEIACIRVEMDETGEQPLRGRLKNGNNRVLISDAYRLDSAWSLGSMQGAVENLKARIGAQPEPKIQVTLFLLDPESMTTLQIEQAVQMLDQSFTADVFVKDVIAAVSVEQARENRALREVLKSKETWNIDWVVENIADAIRENDCEQLAKNIRLIAHQRAMTAIWTLLENGVKLVSSIERNKRKR